MYVNKAAQITLVIAQNKVQNELKYPCSDEEHKRTSRKVHMCLCILLVGMGQLKFQWGELKIKLEMSSNKHV